MCQGRALGRPSDRIGGAHFARVGGEHRMHAAAASSSTGTCIPTLSIQVAYSSVCTRLPPPLRKSTTFAPSSQWTLTHVKKTARLFSPKSLARWVIACVSDLHDLR
eukprot:9503902-Pyramimonas_sp.AAC.3